MITHIPTNQIGISTNIIDNPENIIEGLKNYVPEFKTIEIEIEHTSRNLLNQTRKERINFTNILLSYRQQHALYFSFHAPYLGRETDISSSDQNIRANAITLMKQTMDLAYELNITLFTCHPGYLDKIKGYSPILFDNLRHSLDELAPYAATRNIKICLENTGDERPNYIVLSDQEHKKLCDDYNIALTLDLIHYTSFNEVNSAYFKRLESILPYIKNIHFADMNMPKHSHLPLGEGNFPYHKILNFIYTKNYNGNVIIEERGGRYKGDQYIESGKNYLKFVQHQKKA